MFDVFSELLITLFLFVCFGVQLVLAIADIDQGGSAAVRTLCAPDYDFFYLKLICWEALRMVSQIKKKILMIAFLLEELKKITITVS